MKKIKNVDRWFAWTIVILLVVGASLVTYIYYTGIIDDSNNAQVSVLLIRQPTHTKAESEMMSSSAGTMHHTTSAK